MVEASQVQPIRIITNSFRLSRSPINEVTFYSVAYTPEIGPDNRYLRRQLLSKSRSKISGTIGHFIITGNMLISSRKTNSAFTVEVSSSEISYIISIIPSGSITRDNIGSFNMYLNCSIKEMLSALGYKQLTRKPQFYDPIQLEKLPEQGLDILKGYLAVFSHYLNETILTIDTSNKLIWQISVLQHIESIKKSYSNTNLSHIIKTQLIGSTVMTIYGNFRCYRIEDVLFEENPTKAFNRQEGPSTYMSYYKSRYNISITDLRQPLLQTYSERGRKIINLVPELCVLTGITEDLKRNYSAMSKIIQHTMLAPNKRLEKTVNLARKLSSDALCRQISESYSIQVDPRPIEVAAAKLQLGEIKLGKGKQDVANVKNGNFNINSKIFYPKPINTWAVLMTEKDQKNRDLLIKMILSKAGQIGLNMGRAVQITYHQRDLKNLIARMNESSDTLPEIALIVLPNVEVEMYNQIKEACALSSGIPTQCIRSSRLSDSKRIDAVMMKIVLQIAAKTGSILWKIPQNPTGIPRKTMVVGIDVFHDTVNKSRSVLGFVASIDPGFTSYFNTIRMHSGVGEELAGYVGDCLREALLAFNKETNFKFLPEAVIVYRDGVGDSQIEAAKMAEVESMLMTFKLFEDYNPKLAFVLVNKKTNTKLYEGSLNNVKNPSPGTMVNSVIVPDSQSFYLISHCVTQGQASPTLYRVIYNEQNFELMVLAKLAFNLCYMYPNWTGGIKVPAPTMLAHKLAMLVGQSVRSEFKENLRILPWFL